MEIGRRIYYEIATGNVILTTGERSGYVVETTIEQDFATHVQLSERVPETVGIIQLEYGQYAQEFSDGSPTHVDPATMVITWTWREPEAVEEQQTLAQKVTLLEEENALMALELIDTQIALEQTQSEQAGLLLVLIDGGVL